MKHSPAFLALVNRTRKVIRETNCHEINRRRESGANLHLIDVREDAEWAKGHIKGAVHLGKGVIERDIEAAIPDKNAEIVLYCGGGFRSALAAEALYGMGYTNVLSMDGGWTHWNELGFPVEGKSS